MKVVEIFKSIDGEGITAGYPTVFIRLYGCNLRCRYCDTIYSYNDSSYNVMSIPEIVEAVRKLNTERVTVTGGEPLIHPGINNLLNALYLAGMSINVETNGTIVPSFYVPNRLIYTMDYKLNCSGMSHKMDINIINRLRAKDVLKFVVGSVADMDQALEVIESMESRPTIYFSPVFESIAPSEIVDYILNHGLNNVRVQLQLHKLIWNPETRGV